MTAGIRLLVVGVHVKPDCVMHEHDWDVTGVCAELLGTKDAALWYTAIKNVVNYCVITHHHNRMNLYDWKDMFKPGQSGAGNVKCQLRIERSIWWSTVSKAELKSSKIKQVT